MKTLRNLVVAGVLFGASLVGNPASADPPVYSCYGILLWCGGQGGTPYGEGCGYGPMGNLCVMCCYTSYDQCFYCS
jgi:hypothetical protein